MKIIELRAENIKNLKVVSIRPDGAVILEGKNGAGKSAILDSIYMALTGKQIERPIRDGETRAEVTVNLGDIIVKRVFTEKNDRLEVVNKEGATFKSPQAMLNKLIGDLSFDPLSFAEKGKTTAGAREQRNILAALVGLDFTEANKRREQLYSERTIKNREIKGGDPASFRPTAGTPLPLEALVGQMEKPAEDTPRVEVSIADQVAKVTDLEKQRKSFDDYQEAYAEIGMRIQENQGDIEYNKQEIKALQEKIAELEDGITKGSYQIEQLNKQRAALVKPQEITDEQIQQARKTILDIEEINKKVRKAREYDAKLAQLEAVKKEIAHIEDEMTKIDLEKQDRVNKAQFPIAGLAITDEYVTYKDKPFGQLSTGEQIRISTAVAMALNPQLKMIIIREGSLLDSAGMQEIVAMAQEKDYQVWCERVSDTQNMGIFIEEGEVKEEKKEAGTNAQ